MKIRPAVYYLDINRTYCKKYYNIAEIHVLKVSTKFLMVFSLFLSQILNPLILCNLNKGYETKFFLNDMFHVIHISYMFFNLNVNCKIHMVAIIFYVYFYGLLLSIINDLSNKPTTILHLLD